MTNTPPVIEPFSIHNVYRLQGNNPVFVFPDVMFSDLENSLPGGNWNNTLFGVGTDSFATAPIFGLAYGPTSHVSYFDGGGSANVTNAASAGGGTFPVSWLGLVYYDFGNGNGPVPIGYQPSNSQNGSQAPGYVNQIAFFHAGSTFTIDGTSYVAPVITTAIAEEVVRGFTYNEAGAALGYSGAVFLQLTDFANENYDFVGAEQTSDYINVWVTDVQLNGDAAVTRSNMSIDIDVLANDVAVGAGNLVLDTFGAQNGSVTLIIDALGHQLLRYEPAAGFVGQDWISYNVYDSGGEIHNATVLVTVEGNTVLDFRDNAVGAKFDLDSDPTTPETAAAALSVVLGDHIAGGANPGFLTVYDVNTGLPVFGRDVLTDTGVDPATVTEVFGTEEIANSYQYGSDQFFIGSDDDMTLNGLSGDDIFAFSNYIAPDDPVAALPHFIVRGGSGQDLLEVQNFHLTGDLTIDATHVGIIQIAAGTGSAVNVLNDFIDYTGIESLYLGGGQGSDVIRSGLLKTEFYGHEGDDTLIGGGLSEVFHNENGDDTIYGDGDDGQFAVRVDNDVMKFYGNNRSDFVFTALPDDPLGGKGVLVTSALDANGNPLSNFTGTDHVYGVEFFEFLDGTFTTAQVLGVVAPVTLDFSHNGGILADFDQDPATPDAYSNGLRITLTDSPDGGTVESTAGNSLPAQSLSAFSASPLSVNRIIGSDSGSNWNYFSNQSSRDVTFINSSGDGIYLRHSYASGVTYFDGNSSFDGVYSYGAVDVSGGNGSTLDLLHTDAEGYGTLTTSWGAVTSEDHIKNVWSYSLGDAADIVIGGDIAGNIVNFGLGGGDDIFTGGMTDDHVSGEAGNNRLDGGGGENSLEFTLYGGYSTFSVNINMFDVDAQGFMKSSAEAALYDYTNYPVVAFGPTETFTTWFKNFIELNLSEGNDLVVGNNGQNRFTDNGGSDVISTGGGGDQVVLINDNSDDKITLGAGNNILFGNVPGGVPSDAGIDTLYLMGSRQDYAINLVSTAQPVFVAWNGGTYGFAASSGAFVAIEGLGALASEGTDYIDSGSIERFHFAGADGITNTADDEELTEAQLLGINAPPAITGDLSAEIDEGGGYTLTLADLSFTDTDDDATGVAFTATDIVNGYLMVRGIETSVFTAVDIADGVVKFIHDGSETLAAGFSVTVEDGNEDNSTPPAPVPFTFSVTPQNDAPTVSFRAAGFQCFEQTAVLISDGSIILSDGDAGSGTIGVSLQVGEGELAINVGSNLVTFIPPVAQGGLYSLIGTLAAINAVLAGQNGASVSYIDNSDNPVAATTLQIGVNDFGNSGNGAPQGVFANVPIAIEAVNDMPGASVPVGGFNAIEQTSLNVSNGSIVISDPDVGTGTMAISLQIGVGELTVNVGSNLVTYVAALQPNGLHGTRRHAGSHQCRAGRTKRRVHYILRGFRYPAVWHHAANRHQ